MLTYALSLKKILAPLVIGLAVFSVNSLQAQSIREGFETLLGTIFKDKVGVLGTSAQNLLKNKSIFTRRSWTFRDAGLNTAKVTAFANEICVEKVGAPSFRTCIDYNGVEKAQSGYMLMPNGTGETVKLNYKDGVILVVSEKIECTTGLKVSWATSTSMIGKQQDSITSTTESTGGVGGCS
jgi:hypothetical protein